MSAPADLDTFLAGEQLDQVKLANFAGLLLTTRTESDDSIWAGSTLGGALETLLLRQGGEELVRREIQRIADVAGIEIESIEVELGRAEVRAGSATITITPDEVTT